MKYFSALLLKFNTAIENFGITYVMGKLDEINHSAVVKTDKELESFIISECCKKYNVSKDDISKDGTNKVCGEAVVARDMCFVLMHKHIQNYTHLDIARTLNKKTRTAVSVAINNFMGMEDKVKHEREFRETFIELNDIVSIYKKQLFLLKIA